MSPPREPSFERSSLMASVRVPSRRPAVWDFVRNSAGERLQTYTLVISGTADIMSERLLNNMRNTTSAFSLSNLKTGLFNLPMTLFAC